MKISYNDTQLFLSLSLSTQISIPSDFQSKFSPSLSRSHFTFAQNNCRADNSHERIKRNHFQCLKKNIPHARKIIDRPLPQFLLYFWQITRCHTSDTLSSTKIFLRRFSVPDFTVSIIGEETRHLERSETVSGVAIWREFD